MYNKERRAEISVKIQQMADALQKEAVETNDYVLHQVAAQLALVGSVFLNEKDLRLFGDLCDMFTAKKMLESMTRLDIGSADDLPEDKE